MSSNLDALGAEFEHAVLEQERCLAAADARAGNRAARKYLQAFQELRARGDLGREALTRLLDHSEPAVRTNAAAFLLPHTPQRAMSVLRAAARAGVGPHALAAVECITRWEEGGIWELDPPEPGTAPRPPACSKLNDDGDLYYDWIGEELRTMAIARESPVEMATRIDRLLGTESRSATIVGYLSRAFRIPVAELAILGEWRRFGGGGRIEDAEIEAAVGAAIRSHEAEWLPNGSLG